MIDKITSELGALLTPPPSKGVQFTQARVLEWDSSILSNALEWRGITIRDIPLVEGINALTIRPGDIVGMLGWAPENAKGVGSWWIIGKLSTPGEFVADIFIFSRQVRFMTPDDNTLAYFGVDTAGNPLLALYYGRPDEQRAFQIGGGPGNESFRLFDPSGNELVSSDGFTGQGLARPWIPYLIHPTPSAQISGPTWIPSTSSTSFVDLWQGFNPAFHPRVSWGIRIVGAAGGEWRLRVNPGSGFVTVASGGGTDAGVFNVPGWGSETVPGDEIEIVLQVRNTNGNPTHATFNKLYGRQS